MEEQRALRLMGRILTLSRLKVQSADTQAIIEDLTQLTVENPNLKQGLPVIIESQIDIDLAWLVKILRKTGLQILGVSDGLLAEQAKALELPILPPDHTQPRPVKAAAAPAKANVPAPVTVPTRILTDPVRSGQQVYAENSDLIVLAPVSPGAELIADGSIHVYSTLRPARHRRRGRKSPGAHLLPQNGGRIACHCRGLHGFGTNSDTIAW